MKCFCQIPNSQGHGEEVEGVPRLCEEGDQKEHPLLKLEKGEKLEWIWHLFHGWLQCREACGGITSHTHLCYWFTRADTGTVFGSVLVVYFAKGCTLLRNAETDSIYISVGELKES